MRMVRLRTGNGGGQGQGQGRGQGGGKDDEEEAELLLGQRNWCAVSGGQGELCFQLRCEKALGTGQVRAAGCLWACEFSSAVPAGICGRKVVARRRKRGGGWMWAEVAREQVLDEGTRASAPAIVWCGTGGAVRSCTRCAGLQGWIQVEEVESCPPAGSLATSCLAVVVVCDWHAGGLGCVHPCKSAAVLLRCPAATGGRRMRVLH